VSNREPDAGTSASARPGDPTEAGSAPPFTPPFGLDPGFGDSGDGGAHPDRTGAGPHPAAQHAGKSAGRTDVVTLRVWQLPVRLIHWGLVLSILVLSVTGFYIGVPVLRPAGAPQVMAVIRNLHLMFGYFFIALLLARVAWMFSGNQWERWDQFVPWPKYRREMLWPSLKYYLFLEREPPPVVGHNPLAGATYLLLLFMFLVQAVTGLALEAVEERGELLWSLTGWVFNIAGIPTVRFVHHLIMWLTIGFVVHHVYSAILVDHEERSGEISSIISGFKTVPKDRL
jgi:Ni/Fe-hydrogenase 1 B-type cytochrome subunit